MKNRTPGFKNAVGDYTTLDDGTVLKQVAKEGWGFWATGKDLIYGTPENNIVLRKPPMGNTTCDNARFGSDPAPGQEKACYEMDKKSGNSLSPAPNSPSESGKTAAQSGSNMGMIIGVSAASLLVVGGIIWYVKSR